MIKQNLLDVYIFNWHIIPMFRETQICAIGPGLQTLNDFNPGMDD